MESKPEQESSVSKRIRIFRQQKGMTVADLSRKSGIAASTLREWELGRMIRGEPYDRIAKALGVSISELMTGENPASAVANDLKELESIIARLKLKI